MEVGAVKQAFNNEVILMKKKLNQAKTQTIHRLTRKAKVFVEKNSPEPLKEKWKRKAEAAVNEVLIIKKIKAKDIAKFTIMHKGNLTDYINKPQVDQSKACARLLLHKALQDKYKLLRTRFADMPIEDLLMSRLERKKLKKEAKEKQKKKKGNNNKLNNSNSEWTVSDETKVNSNEVNDNVDSTDNENQASDIESEVSESEIKLDKIENKRVNPNSKFEQSSDEGSTTENENSEEVGKFVKLGHGQKQETEHIKIDCIETENENGNTSIEKNLQVKKLKINKHDKPRNSNRSKNLNEKIHSRRFKKSEDVFVQDNKIVDPFFITATGENYMSVVEPRPPDEFKEIHKQGNRKLRRAALFGHVPKLKPRQNDFDTEHGFRKNNLNFNHKYKNSAEESPDRRSHFIEDSNFKPKNNNQDEPKMEKLHPSWEAKKRQSTILPFQGKKVVFDDG